MKKNLSPVRQWIPAYAGMINDCYGWYTGIIILLITTLLSGCGHDSKPSKTQNTFIVKNKVSHDTLHFTGTIEPLREATVSSPVDGVIEQMNYSFGQTVKKGEVLFILNSPTLQKQYNDALTDYLKAKDNYSIAKTKFNGTEDLWQAGLIAKNNYLSEKSNLNTTNMALLQAWHTLSELIETTGNEQDLDLSSLNLADFDKVQKALSHQHHFIQFKAPTNGILLAPPQTGDSKTNRLSVGTSIKAGQAIALVGDLSGIRVDIEIPEVDIEKIKVGLPATVRGIAFNRQELHGQLTAITAQASNNSNSTLPTFQAQVQVRELTQAQQNAVKVGMSTTIELDVEKDQQLMIPITAVHLVHGNSVVHLQLPNGNVREQKIVTGSAKATMVSVVEGLHEGDVIIND